VREREGEAQNVPHAQKLLKKEEINFNCCACSPDISQYWSGPILFAVHTHTQTYLMIVYKQTKA
jgi:hypothetical protein